MLKINLIFLSMFFFSTSAFHIVTLSLPQNNENGHILSEIKCLNDIKNKQKPCLSLLHILHNITLDVKFFFIFFLFF